MVADIVFWLIVYVVFGVLAVTGLRQAIGPMPKSPYPVLAVSGCVLFWPLLVVKLIIALAKSWYRWVIGENE